MSDVHADHGRLARSHLKDPSVPRPVLIAIGCLLATVMVTVAAVRGFGLVDTNKAYASIAVEPVRAAVSLTLHDREDGAVVAVNAATGNVQAVVEPETGGFVRGVLRGLMRARRAEGIGPAEPFRLVLQEDGDFYLQDATTRTAIDVRAFGPTNIGSFAIMLPREGVNQ